MLHIGLADRLWVGGEQAHNDLSLQYYRENNITNRGRKHSKYTVILETIDEIIYVIAENMKNIDNTDRKILQALQTDCSGSVAEIADRAGVSQTPCWRRIKRLEETGYITRRVALLNARKLNLGLTAFILIKAARHDEEWLIQFASGVSKIPEVLEIHRMAGEIDYLLKIVAADVDDYDRIYKSLIKVVDLSDVSASFSIESIKSTTVLPLHVL